MRANPQRNYFNAEFAQRLYSFERWESRSEQQQPGRIGKYRLVERIAVGGMAEVFLACEADGSHSLDRLIVIKRILPHLIQDKDFVQMFLREARLSARINHPNVVQIYELGEQNGFPFIAMEYVTGSTLKELLEAARRADIFLPVDAVLCLMYQACDGAHAAHELSDPQGRGYGLVHRDLSPHNLMVTSDAHVKLLDFGIAKATESQREQTRTGMLKGKISYMSPEQCRQDKLDRRSDIFAMGIVAWELLAGRKLFTSKSELQTMQAIVQGNITDLRQVRTNVPDPVVHAIERALAVDPEARFASALDMRRALAEAAHAAGITVDKDRTSLLVKTLLGEILEQRREAVDAAVEKTLVTGAYPVLEYSQPSVQRFPSTDTTSRLRKSRFVMMVSTFFGGMALVGLFALVGAWFLGLLPERLLSKQGYTVEGPPIRIAVASPGNSSIIEQDYEPIRVYLERTIHRTVLMEFHEDYSKAIAPLVAGEVAFAFLTPLTYIEAKSLEPKLEIIAIKQFDNSTGYDGYLLVPENSWATKIQDLKGTTMCYPNKLSTTGYALPRAYIREQGLDPDTDFKFHESGNHYQVMRDLIAGICDVGGTYNGAHITAQSVGINTSQLRLLTITGRSPLDAIVAGTSADPQDLAAVKEALLQFEPMRDAGVEKVGKMERITGFSPGFDTDYDNVRTASLAK
jgi:serine/threonine-protein kinase